MIPTIAFLESVERHFSVRYPEQFKTFCSQGGSPEASVAALRAARVEFICDLDRLRTVNVKVGEEQWGDYEVAIAGRRHPKDGGRLWGGMLPFATGGEDVFGFDCERPQSDRVLVWAAHTIVHEYPSLASFCAEACSWGQ